MKPEKEGLELKQVKLPNATNKSNRETRGRGKTYKKADKNNIKSKNLMNFMNKEPSFVVTHSNENNNNNEGNTNILAQDLNGNSKANRNITALDFTDAVETEAKTQISTTISDENGNNIKVNESNAQNLDENKYDLLQIRKILTQIFYLDSTF